MLNLNHESLISFRKAQIIDNKSFILRIAQYYLFSKMFHQYQQQQEEEK